MKRPSILLFLALAACGNSPSGNAMTNAASPPNCEPPELNFGKAENLGAAEQARFSENFRLAFDRACSEGLMAEAPLVDQGAHVENTISVMNAPEANVTSIYFGPSAAPPAMLLESPFGDPPQIPSVEELHEAIYCATKGATPEEQEESGRCLPD